MSIHILHPFRNFRILLMKGMIIAITCCVHDVDDHISPFPDSQDCNWEWLNWLAHKWMKHLSISLSHYLTIYLSTYLLTYLSIHLSTYLPICIIYIYTYIIYTYDIYIWIYIYIYLWYLHFTNGARSQKRRRIACAFPAPWRRAKWSLGRNSSNTGGFNHGI